jgi:uncharacterized protein YsxB (DUF464 family)
MIKAKFTKTDDHFTNLEISGHAEYAEYGKDIVCSAVTAAFSTTINLIDRIGFRYQLQQNDGYINLNVAATEKMIDLILENLFDVLKSIEEDYPKNVKVILKK